MEASPLIAIDGRTDDEKVRQLLAFGRECTELDYKEVINLDDSKDKVEFVKDIVAMANHYPGGFLVVGACDDGTPSARASENKWGQFDTANLNNILASYIDIPITLVTRPLNLDGHDYCVICVLSPAEGLPIPFSKTGGYQDKRSNTQKTAFAKGDFLRRVNGQNAPITYGQWNEILEQHDAGVRGQERATIDELIRRVSASLSTHDKLPPLEVGLSDDTLAIGLTECFENNGNARIRRYCNQLRNRATADFDAIYDLAAVCCYAAIYREAGLFNEVIDHIYDYYLKLDNNGYMNVDEKLTIAIALYVIGSAAVRSQFWQVITPMVNRQTQGAYPYASWLRECQVLASQMRRIGDNGTPFLISLALEKMHVRPLLRPDIPSDDEEEWGSLKDVALDSICSFDLLYCASVYVEGVGHGAAYPGCVEFDEKRIRTVLIDLLNPSSTLSKQLFTRPVGMQGKQRLGALFDMMENQAAQCRTWMFSSDIESRIKAFIESEH